MLVEENPQSEIRPIANHGTSAVSQALRALQEEAEKPAPDVQLEDSEANCRIRIASDRSTRERAYRLAYRVYRRSGYLSAGEPSLCVAPYDARLDTITLLAQDRHGRDWATLTMVMDAPGNPLGLPCDEIYHPEVRQLRRQGCRLGEFTRLALDEGIDAPKAVLQSLFVFGYMFARRMCGASDLLIEVNPRHEPYYRRMLLFEPVGSPRACPRVNGMPAQLLRLECQRIEALHEAGYNEGRGPAGQRLLRFFPPEEQQRLVRFLKLGHKPMTSKEHCYFGLTETEWCGGAQLAAQRSHTHYVPQQTTC